VQLSLALLKAGLGEQSREEARHAIELEPQSPLAHRNRGWILQHDLIGRRLKKGFDLQEAITEYRKANELDPKDADVLADLAILLEHDSVGERYSAGAYLDEAIATYRKIETTDKNDAQFWADNIVFDLVYSRKFIEAVKMLDDLPQTQQRLSLKLASIAATEGPDAAIKQSSEIARQSNDQKPALKVAASILRNLRMYSASADLSAAALEGEANTAQMLGQVQAFRKTKPYNEIIKSGDPRSAIQRFFVFLLDPGAIEIDPLAEFEFLLAAPMPASKKTEALARQGGILRSSFARLDMSRVVAADSIISNMQMAVEGDDRRGYRIRVQSGGAETRTAFVAQRAGRYKIMGFGQDFAGLGVEALQLLTEGNTIIAKQWLDWAREEVDKPGGDDPFAWPAFPKIWTRGDQADPGKMRIAALSLFANSSFIKPYLPELKKATDRASNGEKTKMQIILLAAYRALEQWPEMKNLAWQMLQTQPTSEYAFTATADAAWKTRDWTAWEKAIALRLDKFPEDHLAMSSKSHFFDYQGKIEEGRKVLKQLIDSGRATAQDMNEYGWDALFTGTVDDSDLELVVRASGMTENTNYAIIHTLACLYAEAGKTKEAYELLLHVISIGGLDEPDSAVWYGLGRLAEQYGEYDAALAAYNRITIEDEEQGLPISTWELGQKRIRALKEAVSSRQSAVGSAK